ncbi:uncharacterized protein EV422DRAFT_572374 [Fimicolochytrium jonesii]|uniref:uncharacterized protein n=1 Tax=Fimicolochytrium jonesii TaxID=1396493 RepID=UPI0022FED802|nr:uncharacterized protein EV422DRAFT_572374 [Fimicolochytrium jonesii]KAI8815897.1 hypothetical protein EV422DRAFT_572374 [Fimicolochytrium jonesii]
MEFLKAAQSVFAEDKQQQSQNHQQSGQNGGDDRAIPLPGFIAQHIDSYIDSLKPEIAPIASQHILSFQERALNDVEQNVHTILEQIFHGDFSAFHRDEEADRSIEQSRDFSLDGGQRLVDPVTAPTDRNILTNAFEAAKTFAHETSDKLDNITLDPREKALQLIPHLREKLSALLTDKHRSLADSFAETAASSLKAYIRGNISARELGQAGAGDISDTIAGFFSNGENKENTGGDRALPIPGGLINLIAQKIAQALSTLKPHLHSNLHRDLTTIEASLFSDLPQHIQGPLKIVFGGNPFDDNSGQSGDRDLDRGLISDIGDKLKSIVRGIHEALQQKARAVVVKGHTFLEDAAVEGALEVVKGRVRKVLPGAQI